MEYKSPNDALDIDIFYKVLGYACIYKAEAEGVNKILDTDITISLLRERKPIKLLEQLSKKYKVKEKTSGIYRVEGCLFPLQILVTRKLNKKLHAWLHSLTYSLKYDDAENFLTNCSYLKDPIDKKNASVIVDFVSNINESLFIQILKEDNFMTDAIKKLIEPELINLRLTIENNKKELADRDAKLADKDAKLADKDAEIERLKQQLMEVAQQNYRK